MNGHINTSWNNNQQQQQQQQQQFQQFQQFQQQNGATKYPTSTLRALEKAPSMAGLVNTTVPQRLVNRPVRGHHTPTRNSLRHSRMICLSQQGKGTDPFRNSFKNP